MNIVYIRPSKSRGYLRLGIDTGEGAKAYTLSEREYSELGSPLSGDRISDPEYKEIIRRDMRYRAKIKALNILSFGDNSEKNLKYKLINHGIDRDIADEVTREMVELGYINSHRQLERIMINEVALHHTGPAKLVPKLISKGYSRSDIDIVMESLTESGELDFSEAKARLIEKNSDKDGEELKKILYKNGYAVC